MAGNTGVLEVGRNSEASTAQLKVGFGRAENGIAAFDLIGEASLFPGFGFRFQRTQQGQTNMVHRGDKPFVVRLDDPGSFFQIRLQNQPTFTMRPSGNVGIGVNNPGQKLDVDGSVRAISIIETSDARLKKEFNVYTKGLEAIMHLNPISYKYNNKAKLSSDEYQVGIFAQDLQAVAPELVSSFKIGDDKESYLQLNSSGIKYLLINAIKDQQAIIDDLKDRISDLEEKIQK